jgi:hypothetical protein
MRVHPTLPEINGFCFDETHGWSAAHVNAMARTGTVWLTEFRTTDGVYGGSLIAVDRSSAKEEAARRGLGETVLGQLVELVEQ